MPAVPSTRGGGSRREREPGVWEIRVTVGTDPATGTGVQKSFTHHGDEASARARQRDLVELYGAQVVPAPPQSARMTVRELLETFLASPHQWSPTTWRTHTGEARMLCRDHLGRARLDRMTHSTVERAIARWVHAGASPALISARFRVLHSAISWAVRNKLITSDPLEGMHTSSRPHPRLHLRPDRVNQLAMTADDAVDKARARLTERPNARQRMLNLFQTEQNALLIRLAADSGARGGELTALHTTDLHGRVLSICRASQDGVIGPVKNHLNGRLILAASTAEYWTRHVQELAPDYRRAGRADHLDEADDTGPQWLFRAAPESVSPLLPNGLGQRVQKLAHAAGPRCDPAAATPHCRHLPRGPRQDHASLRTAATP